MAVAGLKLVMAFCVRPKSFEPDGSPSEIVLMPPENSATL